MDHGSCTHARTPRARAACRRAHDSETPGGTPTPDAPVSAPSVDLKVVFSHAHGPRCPACGANYPAVRPDLTTWCCDVPAVNAKVR